MDRSAGFQDAHHLGQRQAHRDAAGLPDRPFCALISNAIFGSYLNRYYSDVLVWTDTSRFGNFSALLPILSVICVIIGNLVVGRLMDSTKSSQGKARPYLILSAPLLAVAIITLFVVPKTAAPAMQMVWIAVSYNLYYSVAYPLYYTAHSSLGGPVHPQLQ